MWHDFEKVQVKGKRVWKDEDGKRRQETKVFYQTINPFNINKSGIVKSREEILQEITEQRDKWVAMHRHLANE